MAARSRTGAPRTRPRAAATASWWPERLNLKILAKNPAVANPLGEEFDYAEAFKTLDLPAVKQDIAEVLTTSQDWWPADFGHYGPFMIRMAWHSAGTYRISDGRGGAGAGQQRFAPLNSWPDNGNLDKARRLLWPVKKKYGQKPVVGRPDDPRRQRRPGVDGLQDLRLRRRPRGRLGARRGRLLGPRDHLARRRALHRRPRAGEPPRRGPDGPHLRQPGGPERQPGPDRRGPRHPRDVPPDGDERRGDRRPDRRRPHLRQDPRRGRPADNVGAEPEAAPIEEQGLGWKNTYGTGKGGDAITSGLEGTWTNTPTTWDNSFFEILFGYEWELTKSPAGANQWKPKDGAGAGTVPDAHDPSKSHAPTMLTTDLSLRFDPVYEPISRRFLREPRASSRTPSPARGSS